MAKNKTRITTGHIAIDHPSVTIQAGTGNTFFNGPVTFNAVPQQRMVECELCGKTEAYTGIAEWTHDFARVYQHKACVARLKREKQQRKLIDAAHEPAPLRIQLNGVPEDTLPDPDLERTGDPVHELLVIAPHESAPPPDDDDMVLVKDDPGKYADRPRPFIVPLIKVKRSEVGSRRWYPLDYLK